MSFEFSGKLIEKYEEVVISEKFKKREFVLERNDNGFVDFVKFQLVQDKTNLLNEFNVGDNIKAYFNIKGNKWNDNYFVNLQAWKLEKEGAAGASSSSQPPPPSLDDMPPEPDNPDDDLPF